ncbi:hypothetical protein HDK90DRAFT_494046 [Phyllosticta capitalensis]|uniref:Secreted protein n=1 Tax=Phyllosticta capitalensis TaxID=121624 RepID=A0ABR1YDL3_9PEZI
MFDTAFSIDARRLSLTSLMTSIWAAKCRCLCLCLSSTAASGGSALSSAWTEVWTRAMVLVISVLRWRRQRMR